MKSYAAIFLLAVSFTYATAQEPVQPAPAPVTEQQQVQQQQQQVQQTGAQAAQVQQPQPAPPPQPQHIVLRVVGSQVRNPNGERLGLIEEVLVSRANGAIEYAIVSPQYPTNSARQVPIPWGALSHAWDQSRAGGPPGANQVFIVNMDARRLAMAPTLDRTRAGMDQTLANSGAFFGQSQPVGATGATVGTVSGGTTATPVIDQGTATTAPVGGTIGVPVDNQVIVPGQRSSVQPGGDNRLPPPEQRVPHANDNTANPRPAPAQGSSGTGAGTSGSRGGATGGASGGASGGSSAGGAAGR